ncbi:hypothetical protein DV735_g977, partial [Chaetothyriales sp. CBS 134920]
MSITKSEAFGDYDDFKPKLEGQESRRDSVRRGSIATIQAAIQKEPGWDKRNSVVPLEPVVNIDGGGKVIDYNTVSWWQAGMLMIAESVSLGILALPAVLGAVGMVPGIILILGLGIVATYTGWVIGEFRHKYPWVHSFGDAGEIIGAPWHLGPFLRELFGWAQTLLQIFTMGSHILTFTICLNTLTNGKVCTLVWSVVGLAVFWILGLPRTMGSVAYISIVSCISVTTAVLITMIDVGINKPIGQGKLKATAHIGFTEAFLNVSNIIFAFAGHSCYFGFIAEMKNPKDWPKALASLQIFDIVLYLVAAVVIYRYAGDEVASPALGSATGVVKKVAWGIALPTIVIAGVIYGHIASKYCFVRLFRGTKHLNTRTPLSTITWIAITAVVWILAWIIAESIPNFGDLLGLIAALFLTAFSYYIPGWFWLFMNYENGVRGWFKDWKTICGFLSSSLALIIGVVSCVLGLWASGTAIAHDSGGYTWSCKSNAQ